jgi:putative SOS response-associated peptidase YedK
MMVQVCGRYAVTRGSAALVTAAVITAEVSGELAAVHPRMPVVLGEESWADWLDPGRGDVTELLAGPSAVLLACLETRPVSRRVDNVRNNDPGLPEPV